MNSITSDGAITGGISAEQNIGSVSVSTVSFGNLSATVTAEEGNIGSVTIANGSILAPLTAGGDIGPVSASRDINAAIYADGSISSVTAGRDLLQNVTAQHGSIGGVEARREIQGDIIAGENIASIQAGNSIENGGTLTILAGRNAEDTTEPLPPAYIGTIRAGTAGGGSISADISATGSIGNIIAYGTANLGSRGEQASPARGDDYTAQGKLRKLDPLLEGQDIGSYGDIQGNIEAASLGSITAYRDLKGNLFTGTGSTRIWVLRDINPGAADKQIVSLGSLELVSWGEIGGSVTGLESASIASYKNLTASITSPNSTNFSSWEQVNSKVNTSGAGNAWSFGNMILDAQGFSRELAMMSWGSVSVTLIGRVASDIIARDVANVTHFSLEPARLHTPGNISGTSITSLYSFVYAGKNISDLKLNGFASDVIAGGDLSDSNVHMLGLSSDPIAAMKLVGEIMLKGFGNSGNVGGLSDGSIAIAVANQMREASESIGPRAFSALKSVGNWTAEFLTNLPDKLSAAWSAVGAAIDTAATAVQDIANDPEAAIIALTAQIDSIRTTIANAAQELADKAGPYIDEMQKKLSDLEAVRTMISNWIAVQAETAADYVSGWSTINVLGNVQNLTADCGSSISVTANNFSGGKIDAKSITINALGDVSSTLTAHREIDLTTQGTIAGTITAASKTDTENPRGVVEIHSLKDISATITGGVMVGIDTWGSITGNVSSPRGGVRLEAYGDISSTIAGKLNVSLVTWKNLSGSVSSDRGYLDLFVGGNVTGALTAGSDIDLDVLGNVTSTLLAGSLFNELQQQESLGTLSASDTVVLTKMRDENSEFEINVTSQGNISSGTISAPHDIQLTAQGSLQTSNVVSTLGGITAKTLSDASVTFLTKQGISADAKGNLAGSFTATAAASGVSLTAHGNINAQTISAGKSAAALADNQLTINNLALQGGTDSFVSLVALGLQGASGNQLQASIQAPGAEVSFYAAGDANVSVNGTSPGGSSSPSFQAKKIEGSTQGTLQGTLLATEMIDVSAWGNVNSLTATTSAGDSSLSVTTGGNISGTLSSGGTLSAQAKGTIEGTYHSGTNLSSLPPEILSSNSNLGSATITTLQKINSGSLQAGGNANVVAADSISFTVSAGNSATVAAKAAYAGNVTAGIDAIVTSLIADVQGTVSAGRHVNVAATTDIQGTFHAGTSDSTGNATISALANFNGSAQAAYDLKIAAYDTLQGQSLQAGHDLTAFSKTLSGSATAGNGALIATAGDDASLQITLQANSAKLSSTGTLTATANTTQNIEVFAAQTLTGSITSQSGSVSATAGDELSAALSAGTDLSLLTLAEFSGTANASQDITATVWENVTGPLTAGRDVMLATAGDLTAAVNASHNAQIAVAGNVQATVDAGEDIELSAGQTISAHITAGRHLNIVAREISSDLSAGQDLTAVSLENTSANLAAGHDAALTAWGDFTGDVAAGNHANVTAAGQMQATITAGNDATLTGYDDVTAEVTAAHDLFFTSLGESTATLTAGNDLTAAAFDAADFTATAGNNASLSAGKTLTAQVTAGSANLSSLAGFTGNVQATLDAAVSTYGTLSGNIQAGQDASASAIGSITGLTLTAGRDAFAFASANLGGNYTAGRDLSLAAEVVQLGTATAGNDLSAVGLSNLVGVFSAIDDVNLYSGDVLTASVQGAAAVNMRAEGNASVQVMNAGDVDLTAAGNLSVMGSVTTAEIRAYGDLSLALAVADDAYVIWSRGELSGSVTVGGRIQQLVSLANASLQVQAGSIGVIRVWGDLDGIVTSLGTIDEIRIGDDLLATLNAQLIVSTTTNDKSLLLEEYPELPDALLDVEEVRAWLRSLERDLKDALAEMAKEKASALRGITNEKQYILREFRVDLGDIRLSEASLFIGVEEINRQIALASENDKYSLKVAENAYKRVIENAKVSFTREKKYDDRKIEIFKDEASASAKNLEATLLANAADKATIIAGKAAEYAGSMARYAADREVYPLLFENAVANLVMQRIGQALDIIQNLLSAIGAGAEWIGLATGVGAPVGAGISAVADLLNGMISLLRGNYLDASLNFAAAVPYIGSAALATKLGKATAVSAIKFLDTASKATGFASMANKVLDVLNVADDGLKLARKGAKVAGNVDNICDEARLLRRLNLDSIADMGKIACFTAGTKIYARGNWGEGYRRIELITTDDEVLSRDENDISGRLLWKRVGERFENFSQIINLHIGGQVIGTTREHPFYVLNKGWVVAQELKTGDLITSSNGRWTAVEEVCDSGEFANVFNFRVDDFHTYFVGDERWGFDLWSHNAECYHYTSKDGIKGMNASRSIDPSQTGYTGHGVTEPVVWLTPLSPDEVIAKGGPKKVLGLTREKAEYVIKIDIPDEKLNSIPGDRGKHIKYVREKILLPPKGTIGGPSGV